MNNDIQVLDTLNKYQSKIFNKMNKVNKSLTVLHDIQNKLFIPSQIGGYKNVDTLAKLQVQLSLIEKLAIPQNHEDIKTKIGVTTTQSRKNDSELHKLIQDHVNTSSTTTRGMPLSASIDEFVHPLLDNSEMKMLKALFNKLENWMKPNGTKTQNLYKEINDDYTKLLGVINAKAVFPSYHPYTNINSKIINEIDKILLIYLNVSDPLTSTSRGSMIPYKYRTMHTNTGSSSEVGIPTLFLWDTQTTDYIQAAHQAAKINVSTLNQEQKTVPENAPASATSTLPPAAAAARR